MHPDKRKEFSKTKFFLALTLTTLIFIIGIIFGNAIADRKLSIIGDMEQDMRTEISAVELQYLLLAEDPCSSMIDYTPLTDELYNIAMHLDHMENSLGEDNKDVIRLKNYYSTLQIKHWLLMKKMKNECSTNSTLIIYFYDTMEACPECEQQGFILTYLRKKYPDVYIYALNTNLDNAAIRTLKSMYSIDSTPSLIIDDEQIEGLQTKDTLLKKINQTNSQI